MARRIWRAPTLALFSTMALAAACQVHIDIDINDNGPSDAGRDAIADAGTDADADADAATLPAPGDPAPPPSLKTVKAPEPLDLGDYVRDKPTAIALGKALFWDMQVGGDGIVACASCHFRAGTEGRSKNALSPGRFNGDPDLTPAPDSTFQVGGPNYQLKKSDFPFHRKADPEDRESKVIYDVNDVVGSQGVTNARFIDVIPGRAEDENVRRVDTDGFYVGTIDTRRVEARNTPTVINAVFNFRNFWDGRAQNEFNGVNVWGNRDPNARVLKVNADSSVTPVRISIKNSSLASQAMQPLLSDVEMSGNGRTLVDIGEKFGPIRRADGSGRRCGVPPSPPSQMSALRPLGKQLVAKDDSVLGSLSRYPQTGLTVDTYRELIEKAFQPTWWNSDRRIHIDSLGRQTVLAPGQGDLSQAGIYTLLEANFALFVGLALQTYEATLVADDTPLDRYLDGDKSAFTQQQAFGLLVFLSQARGRCINCHGGPELTDASVTRWSKNQIRRRDGDVLDFGFNNIGVRSTFEDLGNGFDDIFGNPLSVTRLALQGRFFDPSVTPPLDPPKENQAADGAFKVPGLRNVELTAPYFHNGGYLQLEDIIDMYSRGGDFFRNGNREGKPIAPLQVLRNTTEEKQALRAFLHGLTDERVRFERAPFDHPQIFVANGHLGDEVSVLNDGLGNARDQLLEVPLVGRFGRGAPIESFLP